MAPSLLDATAERNALAGAPVEWYSSFCDYSRGMNTKEVDGVTYTLTRRDAPGPDLATWFWLGSDGAILELEEAELRALRASDVILDE